MKSKKLQIFIAGATGVLGRAVTKQLINAGNNVTGLSRSDANSKTLKELGAEPRSGDLFDIRSVFKITSDCDIIIHLASSIPKKPKPGKKDWQTNNRVRLEGTQNLIEARALPQM